MSAGRHHFFIHLGRRAAGSVFAEVLTDHTASRRRADLLVDRALEDPLLVLTNAWATARAGFPAVATSSGAVAASLGHPDADVMPVDEAFTAIARVVGAVDVPVTADVEAGYGLAAAELVERLLGVGAVGCNLEDTDHHGDGDLVPAAAQAERIAAVMEAARGLGVELVVNARVDLFLGQGRDDPSSVMDEAIDRARRYVAAGATCVYPIRLGDEALIRSFVDAVEAPVNIIVQDGTPTLARLRELGVARASFAGHLFRWLQTQLRARLEEIAAELGR